MISMTRLVAVAAVVLAFATLCPAQENVKPTDLGKGADFKGKKIEMKDKGQVAYLLSFRGGESVRGYHGRHEEHRRAPVRLRRDWQGSRQG